MYLNHDHRGSRDPAAGAVTRQSWLNHGIGNQNQDPDSPVGKIPFGKRVRGVTERDKSRSRDSEGRQSFKDKTPYCISLFLLIYSIKFRG
jgi:hypothetical protein